MKSFKLLSSVIIMFAVQGCYTVIWTPDVAFPTKEKSDTSDSYYEEIYYGEYSPYYEVPWWYSITPPAKFVIPISERTAQETKLRNGSSPEGRTPNRRPDQPIIDYGTPSVDQTPTTTQTTTTGDNSTKKSESTTPQREKGNSSNSRDTRNNDGSRSSDTPRR